MKIKYWVIGGQYETHCYGGTPTLIGAMRLSTKNMELWDNWQGWHRPAIYAADDVEIIETRGWITYADGSEVHSPKPGAEPVAWYDRSAKRWVNQFDR